MKNWRFYGRDKELDDLVHSIIIRPTVSIALYGRRRIGKTELLNRAINCIRALPTADSKPIVYLDVRPNPTRIGEELQVAIRDAGLSSLMDDFKRSPYWDQDDSERFFFDQAKHLVAKGGILCLDEFHNIDYDNGHLVYYIKRVIDVNQSPTLTPNPAGGGIVAAGSHQQKMIRLLANAQEQLYGRFMEIRMKQLTSPVLLEMAAEQGWLGDPRQFLSLYAAYGGVPGLWHQYFLYQLDRPEFQIGSKNPYESWLERFWQYESNRPVERLQDRYDYKGMIELNPTADRILQLISNKPRGTPREEIFDLGILPVDQSVLNNSEDKAWNTHLLRNLALLEDHVKMIKGIRHFKDARITTPTKYRISDNDTRHQLLVKRIGLFSNIVQQTQKNEGDDLERIAAEYLGSLEKSVIGKYQVHANYGVQLKNGPELDVLIWRDVLAKDAEDTLIMGSCKRFSKQHINKSRSPEQVFGPFLDKLYEEKKKPQPNNIRFVLVSPVFTPEQHEILQKRGFETIDLFHMAKEQVLQHR